MPQPSRAAGGWNARYARRRDACTDTNSVDYRAKQFAAQNGFCNAGDTSYPGSQCTRFRQVRPDRADRSATLAPTVRATVSQQQPAYLAQCLVCPLSIYRATAVAQVRNFDETPCILALKGSVSFQGSPTVNSPNCGIASNSTASNAIDFTGNGGLNINAPSFAAGGCSQTGGNQCDNVTNMRHQYPIH